MRRLMATTFLALLTAAPAAAETLRMDTALLRGLDKVTGRVRSIEAPVGQPVRFGSLELLVQTCRERPPEETPESAAFLHVWEHPPDRPAQEVFSGWMFASSPALNAMEHPVYDVWVLDCENTLPSPEGEGGADTADRPEG